MDRITKGCLALAHYLGWGGGQVVGGWRLMMDGQLYIELNDLGDGRRLFREDARYFVGDDDLLNAYDDAKAVSFSF